MKPWRVVYAKEVLENLRDRRTLMTALVFGPLFGPLLFAGMMNFSLARTRATFEAPFQIAVINSQAAPNLLQALREGGVTARAMQGGEPEARAEIAARRAQVVLEIPPEFGPRLEAGRPAPLRMYSDGSRGADQRYIARVRLLLATYSQQLASLRLMLRGVDPQLLAPVAVQNFDVSTPASRSLVILGVLTFFLILSLMTGGVYLAMDTTVGERERGTLEALLATPVRRGALFSGKLLATGTFMLLSMALTAASLFFVLGRVDISQLGMRSNLGLMPALAAICITAPLIPLLAGLMTLVAALARSLREAQAWLGLVQLAPTLPLIFAGMVNLEAKLPLMFVPSLSQHLLITQLLRGESIPPMWLAVSAGATLVLGLLVVWLVARLYRRESLLG